MSALADNADLAFTSITDLRRQFRDGDTTPSVVIENLLARIDRLNPELKCYSVVLAEHARVQAERATVELAAGIDRGPLHGVPVSIKDIFFSDFAPTTVGMRHVPQSWNTGPATVVQRLQDVGGAVITGVAQTTEAMLGGYRDGVDPPLNPWNREYWCGASSSGPAVATSAGLCYGSIASDTGGSIRLPAWACGISGIKPTWGRVSRFGVAPLAPSFDHVGPFARSVRDASLMLRAIVGPDAVDPSASPAPEPDLGVGIAGLRIGIDRSYCFDALPEDVVAPLLEALTVFTELGAQIVDLRVPDVSVALRAWATLMSVEAAGSHAVQYPACRDDYGPGVAAFLDAGIARTAQDADDAFAARAAYTADVEALFDTVDVVFTPVYPGRLPSLDRWEVEKTEPERLIPRFTAPFNLTGSPSTTQPVGLDAFGMPVSVQLVARRFDEDSCVRAAVAFQDCTDWHRLRPAGLTF